MVAENTTRVRRDTFFTGSSQTFHRCTLSTFQAAPGVGLNRFPRVGKAVTDLAQ